MSNDETNEKEADTEKPKKMKFLQKVKQTFKRKPSDDKPSSKRVLMQGSNTPGTSGVPKEQWKYDPTRKQLYSNGLPWGPGAHRYLLPEEGTSPAASPYHTAVIDGSTLEEEPINLGSVSISWEKFISNGESPAYSNSIEDLLSRRCRCPASLDGISASAAASKFWIILHILRGNYPPFLPGMSLRQMIVFRKVLQATDQLELPLQKVPPMGFQKFVEKMWEDDHLTEDSDACLGTPEDILPDDLEKMDDLIMEREERVFVLGGTVAEVLKSWMDDFESKTFFSNGLFDDINLTPNSLLKGFALESSDDFMTIMQPVALSINFITKLNIKQDFVDSIMNKTGIRSRNRSLTSYRIKIGVKQSEACKILNMFWGDSLAQNESETCEIQNMNWMLNEEHLQWLADSIKRKPRRILGLNTRFEQQQHKSELQKREREEVESIMRNTEVKDHMHFDDNQQKSSSTTFDLDSFFPKDFTTENNSFIQTSLQGSSFDGAEPFTELKFDDTQNNGLSKTTIDDDPIPMDPFTSWTDVSEQIPPSTHLAFRPPSRATIYSTDSELSMAFCRMSVDKMSLNTCENDWADIDRLAQP